MIGITGASSGIGRAVVQAAERLNVESVSLVRVPAGHERHYDLTEPLDELILDGLDAVVHLAWAWGSGPGVNAEAGRRLASACRARGVRPVLLSTLSSFAAGTSRYGAEKVATETAFIAAGGAALRSGLIWGSDTTGMLATLARLAGLPLLAPRLTPDPMMRHSSDGQLAELLIRQALTPKPPAIVLAASQEPLPLSTLMARLRGPRPGVPVPIPVPLLEVLAKTAERVHLPLPFRSDSLAALSAEAEHNMASTTLPWASGFPGNDTMMEWAARATSP
jgi:uncharacterized protein YbjT (DUF2867 family)